MVFAPIFRRGNGGSPPMQYLHWRFISASVLHLDLPPRSPRLYLQPDTTASPVTRHNNLPSHQTRLLCLEPETKHKMSYFWTVAPYWHLDIGTEIVIFSFGGEWSSHRNGFSHTCYAVVQASPTGRTPVARSPPINSESAWVPAQTVLNKSQVSDTSSTNQSNWHWHYPTPS